MYIILIYWWVSLNSCQSTDEAKEVKKQENKIENSCLIEFTPKYELLDGINLLTLISNGNETLQIHFYFDEVSFFTDDLAKIKINEKYGYIDKSGQIVIKPQFDSAYD
ncbi:MAG: WG repeat-containing protein, partial [Leptospiraceae bacterium]|nr:WG repeat-containing protein [Leptospiraceae bacterium]